MKRPVTLMLAACLLLFAAAQPALPQPLPTDGDGGILVGRISFIEGQVLRYVPQEKDWVVTVKDTPFGMDDALYSGNAARAEFVMPNNIWARIGANTQIQLIALKTDVSEMDVAVGISRFYDKSAEAVMKVTTPFGYVFAQPGSSFDLYVGDASLEVIALNGSVTFVHSKDNSRYEVTAGSSSLVASGRQVAAGEGNIDNDWDDWNGARDNLWAKRIEVKGETTQYLPAALEDDAYDLDQNGVWEKVNYDGADYTMWRPTTVAPDWAPYTNGRWTDYYGDNCWVPDEPFGYVTHHYGNWVFVDSCNCWYWAPPPPPPPPPLPGVRIATAIGVGIGLGIGFGWTPGRVAWISSGPNIGWVPLAPREIYYARRPWGPGTIAVNNVIIRKAHININNFGYINHAVVVDRGHFYGVNNYNNHRLLGIDKSMIVGNYRPVPVIGSSVMSDYNRNRAKYNYTNVAPSAVPHNSVIGRIDRNMKLSGSQPPALNARSLQQKMTGAKPGRIPPGVRIGAPKATSRIVPVADVNKPPSRVQFQKSPLVANPKPTQPSIGAKPIGPGIQQRSGQPGGQAPSIQPRTQQPQLRQRPKTLEQPGLREGPKMQSPKMREQPGFLPHPKIEPPPKLRLQPKLQQQPRPLQKPGLREGPKMQQPPKRREQPGLLKQPKSRPQPGIRPRSGSQGQPGLQQPPKIQERQGGRAQPKPQSQPKRRLQPQSKDQPGFQQQRPPGQPQMQFPR